MAPASPSALMTRVNYIFAALLVGMVVYCTMWGLGYTHYNQPTIFILAMLFGVFMAFNIGGNDVANSFGTSVGAGTLTIPQALAVAAVFEVSGAVIAGGEVTKTIRQGIVDLNSMPIEPIQFVFIMMSALLAAALWLLFATKKGWPVSTTHAIIGGIVGSALCLGFLTSGADSMGLVQWKKVGEIAISWVLSPLLGMAVAYALFSQIKRHVLDYNDRIEARLKELKQKKKAYKEQHRLAFDLLDEHEKINVTSAMARDAQLYTDADINDDIELESEYYRGLRRLDLEKSDVDIYKALQQWVPLISAVGGMMISAMLLFKGLQNLKLGLSTLHNSLIVGMVEQAV